MAPLILIALLILCAAADLASGDASNHRYKEGEVVPLYANKVGPFHNPSQTYMYFDLPFCSPDAVKEKKEALGEVLNGDRLVSAPYKLEFQRHKDAELVCKKTLMKEEVAKFRSAVNKDYYFQMYYDDLPIWGLLGKVDKENKDPSESEYKTYLYKHIHGDVFRFPKHKSLFAAALGSAQSSSSSWLLLVSSIHTTEGALFTALVVIYALTSGIAGYTATSFYCQLEGMNWVRNLLLTGCLFCGPLFLTVCFLNTVAIAYTATAALPFGTIGVIVIIWTLVTSPLLVLGGIAGKNSKAEFQDPVRTTKYPREIPHLPW